MSVVRIDDKLIAIKYPATLPSAAWEIKTAAITDGQVEAGDFIRSIAPREGLRCS